MLIPWFENRNFSTVTITKYTSISKHTVEKSLCIENADFVERLVGRIESILPDGDMMISFGPDAEHVSLTFEGDGGVQIINFYSRKIKTPSTGFHSYRSQHELSIYQDIDALLFPEINKQYLKIEHIKIQFEAFSILYVGTAYQEGTTDSIDRFLIRDKKGAEQIIEIIAGELPPEPFKFTIGDKVFLLNTFQNNDSDELLYPDYFQILNA